MNTLRFPRSTAAFEAAHQAAVDDIVELLCSARRALDESTAIDDVALLDIVAASTLPRWRQLLGVAASAARALAHDAESFDRCRRSARSRLGASYAALVEQGGKLYADAFPGEVANASSNTWLAHSIDLTLSNFSEVVSGQFGALAFNNASHPDFSTRGQPMTFGYLAAAGGAGFFTSITGIDNDPITLQFTVAAVPEPSSMMLLGSGPSCFLYWRRRRPATRDVADAR
jgi:hypothetical protein